MQSFARTLALALCLLSGADVFAQSASNPELKRFQGQWQVVDLIDDGRVIAPEMIKAWLPSGGRVEIVDNAMLFTSPLDGKRSAKSFVIDPTSYPKEIGIMNAEKLEGIGIYQFDNDRLVVCIADPRFSPRPSDFAARQGSRRMRMVLERYVSAPTEEPALKLPPPPRSASQDPNVAARILSDGEVRTMAVGTWRMNDGLGLLDIAINQDGTFRSYREARDISTFHTVFVQSPVSNGTWTVTQGHLTLRITASTRVDRVNQTMSLAVRSISGKDLIFVDSLGRVGQALKIR